MKWLLVSTSTRTADTLESNVGDEFARVGIQQVIRVVDPAAVFDVLNKEDASAWEPRAFNKAVVCGMPLFWSLPTFDYPGSQNCQEVWWWPRLVRGWPSVCREHFLVWGVGHVFVDRIRSLHDYVAAIQEVLDRSWALVVREPILDHPKIIESICPSAFCLLGESVTREVPLCNLMPTGGHFGYLTKEAEAWPEQAKKLSAILRKEGFVFIAHTKTEAEFAASLGWPADRIKLPVTVDGYFAWYRRASRFFGNRQHGAAVCASTGCPTWGVTYDSRRSMVTRLGGRATPISEATPEALRDWIENPSFLRPTPTPFDCKTEYLRMVDLVRRFSEELAKPPWTD